MSNPVLDALKETTVLASVSKRALGLWRSDKDAADKVNNDHGAVRNASNVKVNRLAGVDQIHNQLVSYQNEAAAILKAMSQPFEHGWWFLPNAKFETFVGEVGPIIQKHNKLRDEDLAEKAADIIHNASHNIGTLNVPVPTVGEMIEAYELKVDFRPIPDSANFKGLDQNTIDKLKRIHDQRLEQAVHDAEHSTIERFVDPLSNFITGIQRYEEKLERQAANPEDKDRTGTFRDTLITNIKDLHDNLASWNISGNPRLTELGNLLASMVNVDPKVLREDPVIRSAAYERAKQVADNLNSWLVK